MSKEFLERIEKAYNLCKKYGIRRVKIEKAWEDILIEHPNITPIDKDDEQHLRPKIIKELNSNIIGQFHIGLIFLLRNIRMYMEQGTLHCYYMNTDTSTCYPVNSGEQYLLQHLKNNESDYSTFEADYSFWETTGNCMLQDFKSGKPIILSKTALFNKIFNHVVGQKIREFEIKKKPCSFSNDPTKPNFFYYPRVEALSSPVGKFNDPILETDNIWWQMRVCFKNQNHFERTAAFIGSIFNDKCVAKDFLIFKDGGSNGKSPIVNTIRDFCPSIEIDEDMIDDKFSGGSIIGKRLVFNPDIKLKKMLQKPKFKQITSGDPLMIRNMYAGEWRTEDNYLRCMLGTNDPIEINLSERSETHRLNCVALLFNFEIAREYIKIWGKIIKDPLTGNEEIEWNGKKWKDRLKSDFEAAIPMFMYYYNIYYPNGSLKVSLLEKLDDDLTIDLGDYWKDFIETHLLFNSEIDDNTDTFQCTRQELHSAFSEYCKTNKLFDYYNGLNRLKAYLKALGYTAKPIRVRKQFDGGEAKVERGYNGFKLRNPLNIRAF